LFKLPLCRQPYGKHPGLVTRLSLRFPRSNFLLSCPCRTLSLANCGPSKAEMTDPRAFYSADCHCSRRSVVCSFSRLRVLGALGEGPWHGRGIVYAIFVSLFFSLCVDSNSPFQRSICDSCVVLFFSRLGSGRSNTSSFCSFLT